MFPWDQLTYSELNEEQRKHIQHLATSSAYPMTTLLDVVRRRGIDFVMKEQEARDVLRKDFFLETMTAFKPSIRLSEVGHILT